MVATIDPPKTVQWQGRAVPVWPMQSIDYSLLLSQDPGEVERVTQACINDGYFQLDLSGIDGRGVLADHKATLSLMERFFSMPIEAKNEFGLLSSHLG